jgi:hypothetical protein
MPTDYPKSRILRERLVPGDLTRRLDAAFLMLESQIEPVATPPDLEDVRDQDLLDGTRARVTQSQQTFYIDRSSVAPPNGSTVIDTSSGVGRWLILPSAGGGLPASVQRYWVGKHGVDTNTGLAYDQAFLTFGAAVAAATAATPGPANKFVITCMDAGIYAEAVTLVDYVSLYAPAATLQGQLSVADETVAVVDRIEVSSGRGVLKPAGQTGISRVEAQTVVATGSAGGALNQAIGGVLIYEVRSTYVQNGTGVGDNGLANGHTHLMMEDLYLTGPALGIARTGAGTTVGYVAHILEIGGGVGVGVAVLVGGGEIHLKCLNLSANTAHNVGVGGVLRLDANLISGVAAGTGPAFINTAGYIAGNPGDWAGPGVPTDLNTALDRIAAVVAANHGAIP